MKLITQNFTTDSVTSVTATSSNSNFPVSNLKHEMRSKVWRSAGTFVIDTTNNKINFKEASMGSELTATLTSGTYSVSGLQTEIKAQLEAAGADTFTVTFSETTGRWTIASDGSYLDLLNNSGTNAAASCLVVALGFPDEDKTGALTYTGSTIAIHTKERVVFDLGSTEAVTSVVLLWPKLAGIKLSNTAVVKVEANATDSWTSPAVSQTLTVDNAYSIASHYFTTDQSYRYWSISIVDPSNAYLHVELGVVVIGKEETIQEPENGFKFALRDGSREQSTDYGHRYVDEYPLLSVIEFEYKYMFYADAQTIENAFRRNGVKKPVFVTFDSDETVFDKNHFAVYGKFSRSFSLGHVMFNMLDTGLSIEEIS